MNELLLRRRSLELDSTNNTIHGFQWSDNQSGYRITKIGNADLNTQMPIQNSFIPCECKHDFSDFAYLQNDVRLRQDGSPANVGNLDYMQWVEITQEFWWTTKTEENIHQVLFSLLPEEGWRHFPKGQLIARYKAYVIDEKGYSVSGYPASTNLTPKQFDTYIKNTNPNMYIWDFDSYNVVALLIIHYLGMFSTSLGIGRGIQLRPTTSDTYGLNTYKTGHTDTMTYSTQSMSKATTDTTSGTTANRPIRILFLEAIYGQVSEFRSGIYTMLENSITYPYVCQDITKLGEVQTTSAGIKNVILNYVKLPAIPTTSGFVSEFQLPYIFAKLPHDGTYITKKCCYASYSSSSNEKIVTTGGTISITNSFSTSTIYTGASTTLGLPFISTRFAARKPDNI